MNRIGIGICPIQQPVLHINEFGELRVGVIRRSKALTDTGQGLVVMSDQTSEKYLPLYMACREV
jgi:hypothetical protein